MGKPRLSSRHATLFVENYTAIRSDFNVVAATWRCWCFHAAGFPKLPSVFIMGDPAVNQPAILKANQRLSLIKLEVAYDYGPTVTHLVLLAIGCRSQLSLAFL